MISSIYGRMVGAIRFLTIFTLPGSEEMRGATAWFPLAGWLMGGVLYLAAWLLRGQTSFVRAFLLLALWELLSRGLHVDALADTADGLMAGGSRQRILAIIDDTRTGSFGILAITLAMLGKFSLLSSLGAAGTGGALVCGCVLARYTMTLLACLLTPARREGLGSLVIESTGAKELVIASLIGLLPLAIIFRENLLFALAGPVLSLYFALYARRKIGGINGDIMGACLELTEIVTLFAFLAAGN
jgi:adenosylcobinamide-GDP ribazoletransferase